MQTSLVECIPNFSEARRPEVMEQIVAAIRAVPAVRVLDQSSDLDHNRTVLTMAGTPEGVEEAAFQAIKTAAELIDLEHHTGEHPRMGATDVVPFVPLSGVTMDECVAIAKRLGERVGRELEVPVYLYEYAASRPDRINLENIRKGQYEGLKSEIGVNPDRKPDFGPSKLGKAGATVIGARNALIAFNVYLTTAEVDVAKKIAKTIRHSSGGLRYVKALGFLVEGRAQVSMNLTNFRETPIGTAVEMIRREAQRLGVAIHHSELVGLIPQEALLDAAVWYTQLDHFNPDQIIESRLAQSEISGSQVWDGISAFPSFLEDVAAATAAPGGGSAAAYAGALGAALTEMVAGLTIGRKRYQAVEADMQAVRLRARELRTELTRAVEGDAAAFEAVLGALKMPKETEEEQRTRTTAIRVSTLNAAHVPLLTVRSAVQVMELAARCARDGNLNAISDAMSGATMAFAAMSAAGYNVRINLKSLEDPALGEKMLAELHTLEMQADEIHRAMVKTMAERGGVSPA